MGHKTSSQRIPPTLAIPHGVRFDPNKTVAENAAAAWEASLGLIQQQGERAARMALKKAVGMQECEFTYLDKFPRVPMVEVGDDLVAWEARDHSLALIELCHNCGEQYRQWQFVSLSGFGEAREAREAEAEPYECNPCKYKSALAGLKRRDRKA